MGNLIYIMLWIILFILPSACTSVQGVIFAPSFLHFKGFDNLVYSIMETEHSVYEKKIGAHNIYLNYVEFDEKINYSLEFYPNN